MTDPLDQLLSAPLAEVADNGFTLRQLDMMEAADRRSLILTCLAWGLVTAGLLSSLDLTLPPLPRAEDMLAAAGGMTSVAALGLVAGYLAWARYQES